MAQQITNNGQNSYSIPSDYGGGALGPGASIVVLDTLQNANNLFGSANPGVSTDPLSNVWVPDGTPGAIARGQIQPLSGADPTAWVAPAPTSDAAAINRLAAAVKALRGSAIP